MMRFIQIAARLTILFFLSLDILATPSSLKLVLVKTLGDEREAFSFFNISSAVLDDQENIYIADGGANFIAKYDMNGILLKKVGRPGSGPGDLRAPDSLNIVGNKLYVHDKSNARLIIMDENLEVLKYEYIFRKVAAPLSSEVHVLQDGAILMAIRPMQGAEDRIGVLDHNGNILRSFFKECPLVSYADKGESRSSFLMSTLSEPVIGLAEHINRMLISFSYPNNPIEFYLYDPAGNLKGKFARSVETKYKFPRYMLESPIVFPKHSYFPVISSILTYKDMFFVTCVLTHYESRLPVGSKRIILVFSDMGLYRETIDVPGRIKFFSISKNGYLLGKDYESELERLYVYKIVE